MLAFAFDLPHSLVERPLSGVGRVVGCRQSRLGYKESGKGMGMGMGIGGRSGLGWGAGKGFGEHGIEQWKTVSFIKR